MYFIFMCLAMTILSPYVQEGEEAGRKELIKLQGVWKLSSGQSAGESLPAAMVTGFSMTVKDNHYEFHNSEEREKGLMVLNPTVKPAQISLTIYEGSFKDQKQLGIYQIDGSTLKLCLAQPGEAKRPDKFESTPQNQHLIFIFTKVQK